MRNPVFLKRGGDRGVGAWENRGQVGYGRQEGEGWEPGFPKWRETGEKEESFAILYNILQKKYNKQAGTPTEEGGKRE